jgi:hypothetical protein
MTYKKRTGLTQLILGPFDFGAPWRGGSFPGGLKTAWSLAIFLCVSNRLKGENRIAQAFRHGRPYRGDSP